MISKSLVPQRKVGCSDGYIEKYVAGDDRCLRHQCELLAGGVMVGRSE